MKPQQPHRWRQPYALVAAILLLFAVLLSVKVDPLLPSRVSTPRYSIHRMRGWDLNLRDENQGGDHRRLRSKKRGRRKETEYNETVVSPILDDILTMVDETTFEPVNSSPPRVPPPQPVEDEPKEAEEEQEEGGEGDEEEKEEEAETEEEEKEEKEEKKAEGGEETTPPSSSDNSPAASRIVIHNLNVYLNNQTGDERVADGISNNINIHLGSIDNNDTDCNPSVEKLLTTNDHNSTADIHVVTPVPYSSKTEPDNDQGGTDLQTQTVP